jgi:hypothetical protein
VPRPWLWNTLLHANSESIVVRAAGIRHDTATADV